MEEYVTKASREFQIFAKPAGAVCNLDCHYCYYLQKELLYPVHIRIEAWDRVGLIRDITTVIAEEKVNIAGMTSKQYDDHTVAEYFTLETTGLVQLSRLLKKIEGVRGIISISRVGDEATVRPKILTQGG